MDPLTLAGLLLVAAPIIGAIPIAYPPLLSIWSAPREEHVATVAAHRRSWSLLNAGFGVATIGTAAGLVVLAGASAGDPTWPAIMGALAVAYAIAGTPWLAVLAIRTRTTPALHDLGLTTSPPAAAETLLAAATGGLFAAFVVATGVVLLALCAALALGGTVAVVVAAIAALVTGIALGAQLVTGDTIPAVLYLPTLLVGMALLLGWT